MFGDTVVTPEKRETFLEALGETANVSDAARQTGISRRTWYRHRERDANFAAEWDEAQALGTAALEDEAVRRAHEGVDEPVFYQGRQCGLVRKYSDTLMIFLLKARKPDVYRERVDLNHSGNIGRASELSDDDLARIAAATGKRTD